MAVSAWLAEDKAAAKVITLGSVAAARDAYDADKALERSGLALAKAQGEGPGGTGFCSSAGAYSGCGQGRLEGFRGAVELWIGRTSALDTITTSLELKTDPRLRANGLVDLAIALIAQKRPEEAGDRLVEAHTIGLDQGSAVILHNVFGTRTLMPPSGTPCDACDSSTITWGCAGNAPRWDRRGGAAFLRTRGKVALTAFGGPDRF